MSLAVWPLEPWELQPLSVSEAQWLFPANLLAKRKKNIVGEMVFFWPIPAPGASTRQWSFLVMVFVEAKSSCFSWTGRYSTA